MAEFTREQQLQAVYDLKVGYTLGHADIAMLKSMARQLLASMERGPVAYMYRDNLHTDARFSLGKRLGNWSQEDINEYEITEIPLYAAPQLPQPAVPDEAEMPSGPGVPEYNVGWANGWNSCREEILQGAEPVSQPYTLPFEQWLSQQTGTIDVECGCVMTEVFYHWLRVAYEAGNYPATPGGYVLVPIEPTAEMCDVKHVGVDVYTGIAADEYYSIGGEDASLEGHARSSTAAGGRQWIASTLLQPEPD